MSPWLRRGSVGAVAVLMLAYIVGAFVFFGPGAGAVMLFLVAVVVGTELRRS